MNQNREVWLNRLIGWFIWLYTPEYDDVLDENVPIISDEPTDLMELRLERVRLEGKLANIRLSEERVREEKVNEYTVGMMGCVRDLVDEVHSGEMLQKFRSFKRSLSKLKGCGRNWQADMSNHDAIDDDFKIFWVNFIDKMQKDSTDFGTFMEYIGKRKTEANPFTKHGLY